MSFNFNITEILGKFDLNEREKNNLDRLFDFTNYLFDDEDNLTKTFNLVKKAREQLEERIEEMFESDLSEGLFEDLQTELELDTELDLDE